MESPDNEQKKEADKVKDKVHHAKQIKDKKAYEKEIEELTDTLQRLQAEFENYKKRVDKEKEEFIDYAKTELIAKLLPVLDSFDVALKNTKDSEKFVKGVEMIYNQLFLTLEAEGLRPIEAEGKQVDPYLHEVMMKAKSERESGIILEEVQKGYMLNNKVLRHSKVKVSENKKSNQDNHKQ